MSYCLLVGFPGATFSHSDFPGPFWLNGGMPATPVSIGLARAFLCALVLAGFLATRSFAQPLAPARDSLTITNLAQLTRALTSAERLSRSFRLEVVVCASSRPASGLLVVADSSGI